MLMMDNRPFKRAVVETIDQHDSTRPLPANGVRVMIDSLVTEHRIPLSGDFARLVSRLLMVGNPERAKKLVASLPDEGLSRGGEKFMWASWRALKLGALIAVIYTVIYTVVRVAT